MRKLGCMMAVVASLLSCTHLQEKPVPDGEECSFELSCSNVRSRFPSECMNKISSVNLFVFKDGNLLRACSAYSEGNSLTVSLPDAKAKYALYFIANVGDVRAVVESMCSKAEEMKTWVYDIGDYTNFESQGVPMALTVPDWTVGSAVAFELIRLVSRIQLSFSNSSAYDVKIKSMALRHSAKTIRPFAEGYGAASSSEVFNTEGLDDELSAADLQQLAKGGSVELYCCENCHGFLLENNTDPKLKRPGNITADKAEVVTYFEIEAEVDGGNVHWDNVTYRFCLGMDTTSNFDIPRNSNLNYNVDFANAPEDTGWTVVPGDPDYSDNVSVQVHRGGYLPSWDSFVFPEASVAQPVKVNVLGGSYTVTGSGTNLRKGDSSSLEETVIVLGNTLYVKCGSNYGIEMAQDGHVTVALNMSAPTEKLMCVPAASNANGKLVRVEHLASGGEYTVYAMPYSRIQGRILEWDGLLFPDAVVDYVGENTVNDFYSDALSISIYKNSAENEEDTGSFMALDGMNLYDALRNTGPAIDFSSPSEDCYLAFAMDIDALDLYGGFWDMHVFRPEDCPLARSFTVKEMDNATGDLCASSSLSFASVSMPSGVFRTDKRIIKSSSIPYGSLNFTVNSSAMNFSVGASSCGRATGSFMFWDYDSAPGGWYVQTLDVYLDVTYVPKMGILQNAGVHQSGNIGGAEYSVNGGRHTLYNRNWGCQFVAAREDSRILSSSYIPGDKIGKMLKTIGLNAPTIVSGSRPDWLPESMRVAWYNAGSILNNGGIAEEDADMPNDGSIYFFTPWNSTLFDWYLEYSSAGTVSSPYHRYMFKTATSMSESDLSEAADKQLGEMKLYNPVFEYGGTQSKDVLKRELEGGILVNYHINCEKCLQQLLGNWRDY